MFSSSVATDHGLRTGVPQPSVRPKEQPSTFTIFKPYSAMKRLTDLERQYAQALGHSMASLLPCSRATRATASKRHQSFLNKARCARIFFRAVGNLLLTCCHAEPPVHGMAAHTKVLGLAAVFRQVCNPSSEVASTDSVMRMQSQSFGAHCPRIDASSVQNSSMHRPLGGVSSCTTVPVATVFTPLAAEAAASTVRSFTSWSLATTSCTSLVCMCAARPLVTETGTAGTEGVEAELSGFFLSSIFAFTVSYQSFVA